MILASDIPYSNFKKHAIAEDCTITIDGYVPAGEVCTRTPQNPTRILRKGDVIVHSGGDMARVYFRLGNEKGEKITFSRSELSKIKLEE